ncbi:MAG: hypothetical protein ACR2PL_23830 [Dehalococcoidia bacterium]
MRYQVGGLDWALRTELDGPAGEEDPNLIRSLQEKRTAAQAAYKRVLAQLQHDDPSVAVRYGLVSLSLAQIRPLLDQETTLLCYSVTPQRTLVFTVAREDIAVVELPIGEREILEILRDFGSATNAAEAEVEERMAPSVIQQLRSQLIVPVQDRLTTPLIGVVPDGVLSELPFAQLLNNGDASPSISRTVFTLPIASAVQFHQ